MTRPRTTFQPGDEILSEIADLLIAQNRLLGDIRDRLPGRGGLGQPDPGPVKVSEPAPGKQAGPEPEVVPIAEPAPKSAPAKKATPRKATPRRHT